MKIGFDAKRYFNNQTGLGNYSRWLLDGLISRNAHNYNLYLPKKVNNDYSRNINYASGIGALLPSIWRIKFINSTLKKDKIEIYHGLSNELPFGIHKTGIKTVVTIHDLINKRYPKNYSMIDGFIYEKKVNYAQQYANAIVVPSTQTKEDLIHYYKTAPHKIKVIPLSLPIKIINSKKKPETPYILCVSSFDKRKNLTNLVKAFAQFEGSINLVLAGKSGEMLNEVLNETKEDARIQIRQNVSNEELSILYANSIFCIYPSVFEGFGIPILEAFQHHKTVATSNLSSMPEVGGNAAEYFDPNSIDSILKSIKRLSDDGYRSTKENLISEQLKKFDSNLILQQYESLYTSL
ncbi:MAG: glycosyl transferase family 1 [Bacteroidetes bacterium]|nr:MAG: glycosyl transferase family 1 [Bacteroidota bacterium]